MATFSLFSVKQNQQINDEPEIKQEAVEIKQEPMDDSEDAGSDEVRASISFKFSVIC